MAILFLINVHNYVYQCCMITIIMMTQIRKVSMVVLSILFIILYETCDHVINGTMIKIIQMVSILSAMMMLKLSNSYFKFIPMITAIVSTMLYIKLMNMGIGNLGTTDIKSLIEAIPLFDAWLANNFAVIFCSLIQFCAYME